MKRKLLVAVSTMLFFFSITVSTINAQNINYRIPNPSRYDTLEEVISAAASLIRPVFILTLGGMILYGAIQIGTAREDDSKIANGKKTITAAIIGFIIAVFAPSLVNFLIGLIGADGFGTL